MSESVKNPFLSTRVAGLQPSGIRRFFDIVATMPEVISLGIGEPDFVTPAPIVQAGIGALHAGDTHYTSNAGRIELRQALAEHLHDLHQAPYNPVSEMVIDVASSGRLSSGETWYPSVLTSWPSELDLKVPARVKAGWPSGWVT